jgi:uncharacterized protein (DUF2235 family)
MCPKTWYYIDHWNQIMDTASKEVKLDNTRCAYNKNPLHNSKIAICNTLGIWSHSARKTINFRLHVSANQNKTKSK